MILMIVFDSMSLIENNLTVDSWERGGRGGGREVWEGRVALSDQQD